MSEIDQQPDNLVRAEQGAEGAVVDRAPRQAQTRGREGVSALLKKAAEEQFEARGTSTPGADDKQPEQTNKLDDLPDDAGDLDGAPAPQGESSEQPGEANEERPGGGDTDDGLGTLALDSLAERAGLTVEELYGVALPLGDGRDPVTLGTLKDRFNELARVDDARGLLDEQRTDFENNMIRSRQELSAIIAQLPEIPPALLQQAVQAQRTHLDTERAALREAKAEWKDPEVFRAAQDQMLETVEVYGFNRTDLDMVLDHRLVKLVYDYSQLKKKFAAANAKSKEITSGAPAFPKQQRQTGAKRASRGQQEILKRARTGTHQDKVAGVSALLQGKK